MRSVFTSPVAMFFWPDRLGFISVRADLCLMQNRGFTSFTVLFVDIVVNCGSVISAMFHEAQLKGLAFKAGNNQSISVMLPLRQKCHGHFDASVSLWNTLIVCLRLCVCVFVCMCVQTRSPAVGCKLGLCLELLQKKKIKARD